MGGYYEIGGRRKEERLIDSWGVGFRSRKGGQEGRKETVNRDLLSTDISLSPLQIDLSSFRSFLFFKLPKSVQTAFLGRSRPRRKWAFSRQ